MVDGRGARLVIACTAALGASVAAADDVRGRVVDRARGTPIAGATVLAGDREATTGADGGFALTDVPPGPVAVIVSADPYPPVVRTIAEAERDAARIALALDGGAGAGELIQISGKPPDTAEPTTYTLARDQVRALPGTGNDVLRAAQSLPGVGRVAYGLGGLVLRGTDPHDSNVYLDGIEVPIAFHFAGLSSFYPSTLLEQLVVTPGGGEVRWGRGLGGVVELRSRAPRADRVRIGGELGLLDASTYGEVPTFAGGAIALGVRRSYADAFLAELWPANRILPRYYDGQLRWDQPLGPGTLTALAFFSDDRASYDRGAVRFHQFFVRAALRYHGQRGRWTWSVLPWGGVNAIGVIADAKSDATAGPVRDFGDAPAKVGRAPFGLRADLVRTTGWGQVAAGVDVQGARVLGKVPDPAPVIDGGGQGELGERSSYRWFADVGLWADLRWRIDDGKLTVRPGLRADRHGIPDAWTLEPRVVTTHELSDVLTLRESLGLYHQPPAAAWLFVDRPRVNEPMQGQVIVNGAPLTAVRGLERGVHAAIGADLRLDERTRVSATWFHSRHGGVGPPLGPSASVDEDDRSAGGGGVGPVLISNLLAEELRPTVATRGRSRGLELSLQATSPRWLLWISYTWSRAERHPGRPTREGWAPYELDQPHNLSANASVALGRWQLGARLRVATGFPYTPQLVRGDPPVLGPENSATLPGFRSVDVRVDRRWRRRWGTIGAFFDVQNLTNADNPEGIVYRADGSARYQRGLPIFPMIGVGFTPPEPR